MDRQLDRCMHGWTDRQIDRCMHVWMDRQMDRQMNIFIWTDVCMDGQTG